MLITIEQLQEKYPANAIPSARWLSKKAAEYGIAEKIGKRIYVREDFIMVHLNGDADYGQELPPAPGTWDNPSGWVYFIASPCGGFVKIGRSVNAQTRMRSLQVSHYGRLALIFAIEGAVKLEAELHERFKAHHSSGEWFRWSEEIADFIDGERSACIKRREG